VIASKQVMQANYSVQSNCTN